MDHVRLYRNELTRLGYGNPVWEPNPDTLYDCVRIGDVGYFQNEKFVPLFNILPPDDSTRNRHLPFPQPTFPALHLPDGFPTTHNTNPLQAGVYALESSLTFSASVGVDGAGSVLHGESSLSFTNEKGAALILPFEARREDTLYDLLFKKHMIKYYRQWYNHATAECHRNVKLYDIILVTGCDLTCQWATATYFRNNREISAALGVQVAPVAEAKFSLSAGWSTTQAMNTRRGPPRALHDQTHQNETENESETLFNNQCIFLRGFYVKDRLWGPRTMKAGAGYHDPGKHGPEEEGAEDVFADDGVTVESLSSSRQSESFMTVLLDYMLEECDADIVIAHDYDLWPYLGEVANPENFRDALKRMSRIKVEDRVGSLVMEDANIASISSSRQDALSHLNLENPSAQVSAISSHTEAAPRRSSVTMQRETAASASTEPLASGLRYRGRGLLLMFNGPPVPHEEALEPSLPRKPYERLFINITVNRAYRLFLALALGVWDGWSCLPDKKRIPTSTTWVIFVTVWVNWTAVSAVLDCLWPTAMNWYFRAPLRAKLLYTSADNNPPSPVKITLYRVGNTLLALGYLLARVIRRQDDQFISNVEYVAGGLAICSLWAGWAESHNRRIKWLFQNDYRDALFLNLAPLVPAYTMLTRIAPIFFAAVTWWWIAYRIAAVTIIFRRRYDEEMKTLFQISMFGLIVEGIALCTFLALPIIPRVFKDVPWHPKLWYSHLGATISMLSFWAVVLMVGFGEKMTDASYPCTDSTSPACKILI